jgi:hypothetical protein
MLYNKRNTKTAKYYVDDNGKERYLQRSRSLPLLLLLLLLVLSVVETCQYSNEETKYLHVFSKMLKAPYSRSIRNEVLKPGFGKRPWNRYSKYP